MKKSELIEAVAIDSDISKAAAERALDSFTAHVKRTMRKGDSIAIPGFGTFGMTRRKAREGRNPATGTPVQIKARNAPTFKASVALKAALN